MWRVLPVILGLTLMLSSGIISLARRTAPQSIGIVYSGRGHSGLDDLYYFDLASRLETNLTNTPLQEAVPYFDAEGQHISYALDAFNTIRIEQRLFATHASQKQAEFHSRSLIANRISPNREWIAVAWRNADESIALYRVRVGEPLDEPVNLPACRGWIPTLQWSADSEWLTFAHRCLPGEQSSAYAIYQLHMDSDTPSLVYADPAERAAMTPTWSPDGDWIVFRVIDSPNAHLYRIHKDTLELHHIIDTPPTLTSAPDWSPDGQWIAVLLNDDNGNLNLFRIHPDGTDAEQLTHWTTPRYNPDWRPIIDLDWQAGYHLLGGLVLLGIGFFRRP